MNIKSPAICDIPALRALWKEAFGDTDAFLDCFFTRAFLPERCRIVCEKDEVSAVLYWFDCSFRGEKVAYIYAVATAKQSRGKGLCRLLFDDTHRHLLKCGYSSAVLVPHGDKLFSLYEKFGYRTCTFVDEFDVSACNVAMEICEITKLQYAEARRKAVGDLGVIQENENLDFLEGYAGFYKGDGLLFCAGFEDDGRLRVYEYFGRKEDAAAVVRALGAECGRFRMPGSERPFAMYKNLGSCELEAPEYFGLAFD